MNIISQNPNAWIKVIYNIILGILGILKIHDEVATYQAWLENLV